MNCPASVLPPSTKPLPALVWRWGRQALGGIAVLLLVQTGQTQAARSAERITLSYGLLERSVTVEALEYYAEQNQVSADLAAYLSYLDAEQVAQLRQALITPANLDTVAVAQFLYTEQGEILLRRFGEVVRTESNQSGFYALRSALILAAAQPDGLTALNVLKQFPLDDIRIDLRRTLSIFDDLQAMIRRTQEAVALIDQQANQEADLLPAVALGAINPGRPGSWAWQTLTLTMQDLRQNRTFPVDLYLPQTNLPQTNLLQTNLPQDKPGQQAGPTAAPVVVISHGLGSDRSTYAYLARRLASYGFVVAVPEHPGSNADQLQALIAGTASQVATPSEFIDRPLDIKYLLDQLARLNQSDPNLQGRFDLDQVGVVGQSFGGYTALALAGAKINFQQLATDCARDESFNLSLLLQCRAQELPRPLPDLADPRVKAIVAINPIGSSLLGAADFASIQIPVMLVSGSADTIAPALLEQIQPFTWLNTPERYLVLLQGGTHFSTIDVPPSQTGEIISLTSEIVGPDPRLAQAYLQELGVAFFQTYLAQNRAYLPYLESAYVQSISQSPLPISLVRSLTPAQLASIFGVLPELPWLPLDMEFSHFQEMNRFRLNQSVHSPADRGLSAEKSV
ncbi:MAG: alpha/beta hydrolase [Elainella sp.]